MSFIKPSNTVLVDLSPMPFGKHKGKPMQDVPVEYLHYLWHNGLKYEHSNVAEYIRKNIDVLQTENKDLVWS